MTRGRQLQRLHRDMRELIDDAQMLLARFEDLMSHGYPATDVEALRVEVWAMTKIADWLDGDESEDEE